MSFRRVIWSGALPHALAGVPVPADTEVTFSAPRGMPTTEVDGVTHFMRSHPASFVNGLLDVELLASSEWSWTVHATASLD